jgi:hypothetical protein
MKRVRASAAGGGGTAKRFFVNRGEPGALAFHVIATPEGGMMLARTSTHRRVFIKRLQALHRVTECALTLLRKVLLDQLRCVARSHRCLAASIRNSDRSI